MSMNLAHSIASDLAAAIDSGRLPAGSKLASVRAEAAQRGISPTTMSEVYELLKAQSLVEARPRSGYFVAAPRSALSLPERPCRLLPSASLDAADLLQDMLSASDDPRFFPFGTAIPRPAFLPQAKLQRLLQQTLRDDPALLSSYRFAPGNPQLRAQLAQRYQRFGVKASATAVVTTAGAIESIGLALGVVAAPGATIGIETPTYTGIFQLVRSLGYRVLEIPLDATRGLTPAAFESAVKTARGKLAAVVTIPNFSNPLGTLMDDADKQALVALASRHGVALVEDDIYADLGFARQRPRPLKAFDKDDSVLLCTSFTKTISPALRSGCIINARHADALSALKYARGSGISALAEAVLQRFLEQGHLDRHLTRVRGEYQRLLGLYSQRILQLFPAGTGLSQPRGGYILWVELPRTVDAALLQKQALRQRISVAPGSIFSANGSDYGNFLRLNCAIPWTAAAEQAVTTLARLASA